MPSPIDGVHVIHIEVEHCQERFRALPAFAHHDDGIADFDFGKCMIDPSGRRDRKLR